MGRNRQTGLLAALALAAWCLCALLAQRVGALAPGPMVRWSGAEGPTPVQLRRAEAHLREDGRENLPRTTLWREQTGQMVSRPEGGGASADVVEGCGALEDLFPLSFSSGGPPARGDAEGCALDEKTAAALWGGVNAVGRPLLWNGRNYVVRGVFRGAKGLVLVQGDEAAEEPYPGLLLAFPEGGGRSEAEDFLSAAGVAGGAMLDLSFLHTCLGAVSALPAGVLLLWLLALLLGRGWLLRGSPLLLACYLPPALLGAGAALWAAGFPWHIPAQLIPSRWSDFEFWPRLLTDHAGRLAAFLGRTPGRWDWALWPPLLGCLLLAAAAAGLAALAAQRVRISSGRAFFGGCALLWGGLFLTALGLSGLGGVALSRGMWLLPPLFLAGRWGLHAHAQSLKPRGGKPHETPRQAIPTGGDARPPA